MNKVFKNLQIAVIFFFLRHSDVLMFVQMIHGKNKKQALAFFHSLHSRLRVFAFLLNCFCTIELHCCSSSPSSRTLPIPKKRGRVRVRRNLLGGVRWQTTVR